MVAAPFRLRNLLSPIDVRSQADPSASSGQAPAPTEKWHFGTASKAFGYRFAFHLAAPLEAGNALCISAISNGVFLFHVRL
jgi:hypothetical protein